MSVLEAFLLGILQGATEFFPVSSSGHLVMGQALMGIQIPGILFEVVVHLATLLSVLLVYRVRLLTLAGGVLRKDREALSDVGLLALATLPVGVVGVLWGDALEAAFQSPRLVGVALLFTGTLLLSSRWALRRPLERQIDARIALGVGLAQCVALLPGVSRSGMTVVTALWLGVAPVQAAAFSFLLSIPTIGGAAVLSFPNLQAGTPGVGALPLTVAAVAAAVTGVLAIRAFVRLLRNRAFPIFALYCWGVGLLFLGWLSLSGA